MTSETHTTAAGEIAAIAPTDLIAASDVPIDDEFGHLYSTAQWAWAMRNRDRNGLNSAVVVLGDRRLFISRSRFSEWLASRLESEK